MLAVGVAALRGDELALPGGVQGREARVVELEVRAAELAEPPHLLAVRRGEVAPERVQLRVDGRVDRRAAAAVVDHARRRDRQLRGRFLDGAVEEAEVVAEDRVREPEPPADVHPGEDGLDIALVAVEGDPQLLLGHRRDAVELVDEVHVPRPAAELAVGHGPQADLLLHPDDLADRVVLDRAQLDRVDTPFGVVLARLQEPRRAQEAAHVVGAERRLHRAELYDVKRASEKKPIGCRVAPSSARSARTSPTALQNLKPWPEKPAATTTCGESGCRSITKCSSGLSSKRQGLSAIVGPLPSGK